MWISLPSVIEDFSKRLFFKDREDEIFLKANRRINLHKLMLHALYLDCLCAVCKNLCEYSLYSTSSINDLQSSIYSPVIRRQLRILQKEWVQEWLNSYARRLVL